PTELPEGAKAPAFNLPRDGGGSLSLADFKGRKLVLYFYPKADPPGCTREAIEFSKLRAEYQKAGADVLGVSADPVEAQDKFKKKPASASRSLPTRPTRCSRPTASGAKNPCTAGPSWELPGPPS